MPHQQYNYGSDDHDDPIIEEEKRSIADGDLSEPNIPGGVGMADEEAVEAEEYRKGTGDNNDPDKALEDSGFTIE